MMRHINLPSLAFAVAAVGIVFSLGGCAQTQSPQSSDPRLPKDENQKLHGEIEVMYGRSG